MLTLLRLTRLAFRYPGRMALAYLTLAGGVAAALTIPKLLGSGIDELLLEGAADRHRVVYLALGIVVASLLRGLFDFGRVYYSDTTSQMVAYDMRNDLFDTYQHLSFAYHDTEHTGNLMSKATADIEGVRRFINMGLIRSIQIILMISCITFLMFRLDWSLAMTSLSFLPFIALRASVVVRQLRRLWTRVQELMGEMVTILQENLSGMSVVKSFAAEEYEKEKFARKTAQLAHEGYLAEKTGGSNSAVMTFFFTLTTGLIVWYGGRQVIQGDLTTGGLAQFVFYMSMLAFPIRMAAWTVNTFPRAISSGERIFQVLDSRSLVVEKEGAIEMARPKGEVRFEEVSFSYNEVNPILNRVTFTSSPGEVTAILGAPGSGKTTVMHLIPRFYDPTGGRITIDGQDVRDFTLESLRRYVGIVQQDVFLFTSTIKDNIAYGAMDSSLADVVRAAKIAQLHEFIVSLPDGYDTWVGEQGATLSGGQRQRLAIARTLLIDPPVLILDDSTSSVDVETEQMISQALKAVINGRTTFVIAHRLSTVRNADWIQVMKDGEIVERGTHTELFNYNGFYREIYELQLKPQEELSLGNAQDDLPSHSVAGLPLDRKATK
jgi:ABC-type multidrug transport system fused ATPase/permease subunit